MTKIQAPRFPYIVDGRGQFAQVIPPWREYVDEHGLKVLQMRIRPHPLTKQFYKISEDELDEHGTKVEEYFEKFVKVLNPDPVGGFVLLFQTFDHQPTILTELNFALIDTIKNQQKQIDSLKKANAKLHFELKKSLSNPSEFWEDIIDIQKNILSVRGQMVQIPPPPPEQQEGQNEY